MKRSRSSFVIAPSITIVSAAVSAHGASDPCWATHLNRFVRFSHVICIVTPAASSDQPIRDHLFNCLRIKIMMALPKIAEIHPINKPGVHSKFLMYSRSSCNSDVRLAQPHTFRFAYRISQNPPKSAPPRLHRLLGRPGKHEVTSLSAAGPSAFTLTDQLVSSQSLRFR